MLRDGKTNRAGQAAILDGHITAYAVEKQVERALDSKKVIVA
ncbi:MAG: hypothetical protein AAF171_27225 [Cyanobacteria bacterium P01_A01_bin.116]